MADQPGLDRYTGGDTTTGGSRWVGAWFVRARRAIHLHSGMAPSALSHGASGQIVALFALSLVAMVPVMALIIDGGNIYVQRRTTQNAADAASIAGSRALMNATANPDTTVAAEVCKYLAANTFGTTPTATARFVGTNGLDVIPAAPITTDIAHTTLDCSQSSPNTIPNGAAGVRVDAQIAFNTYLAGIALGGKPGVPNMTTKATAGVLGSAIVTSDAHNAPFIICGVSTKVVGGGTHSLLLGGATPVLPYQIDPTAANLTFVLHDNTAGAGPARCGLGTGWKGLADIADNGVSTLPSDLFVLGGTNPATVTTSVDGYAGCGASVAYSAAKPCVMILPIASGLGSDLTCVLWAAFEIITIDTDHHNAKLLANYTVVGSSSATPWTWATRTQSPVTALALSS